MEDIEKSHGTKDEVFDQKTNNITKIKSNIWLHVHY